MATTCPKCNYLRTAADSGVPDWQCPRCGIAYAKFADRAPPAPQSAAPSSFVSLIAAASILAGAAAFGYYAYDKYSARKAGPARSSSKFVEGERLVTSNPAFYGTLESGRLVLRTTPETAAGLAKISSSARVVMFATSWCPYCAEARGLFEKNGVRYTELDIECDESAKDFWSKFWG